MERARLLAPPGALRTTVGMNGLAHIEFPTNRTPIGVARFIATITDYITLRAGDAIWTGTGDRRWICPRVMS
jgi:2-keto-4-pentenoate hydratase/2-oxohepta-3-ene-1,7-dioic acid hydratase in catechol pathway